MLTQSRQLQIRSRRLATDDANPGIRDLLAYWDGKRSGRGFPDKAEMRPEELKPYLGNLSILEVTGEPPIFRYRLVGSRLADAVSQNATGVEAREVPPPEYGAAIHRDLLESLEAAAPTLHEVTMEQGATRLSYQRLTLPLADGGDGIAFLMTYSLRPETFKDLFRRFGIELTD